MASRGTDVRSSHRGVLIEIVTEMFTIAQELVWDERSALVWMFDWKRELYF